MDWMTLGDIFWFIGALIAAGFCLYGGWFSITELERDRIDVTGDARSNGATPGAKLRAPRQRATARALHRGTRQSHEDVGVTGA